MIIALALLQSQLLSQLPGTTPAEWLRALPPAGVTVDAEHHEIVIETTPVDVPMAPMDMAHMDEPGGAGHMHEAHAPVFPPVLGVDLPVSGWVSGFRIELVDARGHRLPDALLHHYNLIDPNHRELFLPISRRVLAAGSETGAISMPRWIFGLPFVAGERLVASVMLHNPTMDSYTGVRTRLILTYTETGHFWPLWRASPWQLDVMFPVGKKSFDLPPGRFAKSYEGSPAIPGKILGIGGHVHDLALALTLTDATTGDTIWNAKPIVDGAAKVVGMPQKKFFRLTGVGVKIVPEHRYRVTVTYNNPTGAAIRDGGMGVVAGLFEPASGVRWPAADQTDTLYIRDLRHALRLDPEEPTTVSAAAPASAGGVVHTQN